MIKNIQKVALEYFKQGLQLIPIRPDSKIPAGLWKKWQYKPQTEADIKRLFPADSNLNIGVICGVVSGYLTVIDIDSFEIYERLLRDYKRFGEIVSQTRVIQTGRGYHVYLTTDEPIKSENLKKSLGVEIKSNGTYILCPPSVHKETGVLYRVISDTTEIYKLKSLDELGFITLKPDERKPKKETPTSKAKHYDYTFHGLGQKTKNILKGNIEGYPSRSEAEAAVVFTAIRNRLSWEQTKDFFLRFATEKTKFKDKGTDGIGWLWGVYNKELKYYKENIKESDKKILSALTQVTENNPFTGRSRNTDREVLLVFLQRSLETGQTNNLQLSRAELTELASIAKKTAGIALSRLIDQGYLTLSKKSEGLQSNAYTLNMIKFPNYPYSLQGGSKEKGYKGKKIPNDAFRWRALGKLGEGMVKFINGNVGREYCIKGMLEKVDMGRKALFRQLEILQEVGIIDTRSEIKSSKGRPKTLYRMTREVTKTDLKHIADNRETYGQGERVRVDNAFNRTKYRSWCKSKTEQAQALEIIYLRKSRDESLKGLLRFRVEKLIAEEVINRDPKSRKVYRPK